MTACQVFSEKIVAAPLFLSIHPLPQADALDWNGLGRIGWNAGPFIDCQRPYLKIRIYPAFSYKMIPGFGPLMPLKAGNAAFYSN